MKQTEIPTFTKKLTASDKLGFLFLFIRDILLKIVSSSYRTFTLTFRHLPPRYIEWSSHIRAKRAFSHAAKKVPAYKDFIQASETSIPETDKDLYIRKYDTEMRCLNGRLPAKRVAIDESSGSTGTPYNWVRSNQERKESHHFISYFARYCYGNSVDIAINAFSLGAWATGLNMGIALERNFIVKNTGPDMDKIFHTLEFFGPKYRYLIVGYPPFLKWFIDVAKENKFPIKDYDLQAMVGGEGMTEGLRDYLYQNFKTVYSGYGATDLEIGIAGETPVSVALRRLTRKDNDLRQALFGTDSRLPMVFQYNPLMHFIEINNEGEMVCTITRKSILSPRVRYNIHDQGGILRYDQMQQKLKAHGYNLKELENISEYHLQMPFLWIYGRKDFTISIMGANIYPEDIEQFVYGDPELASLIHSFCQTLVEQKDGSWRPGFYFETKTQEPPAIEEKITTNLISHLRQINNDFKEAWNEYPDALQPIVKLYGFGQGPFATDKEKIKQKRLV